jgi:hypothetical protein
MRPRETSGIFDAGEMQELAKSARSGIIGNIFMIVV